MRCSVSGAALALSLTGLMFVTIGLVDEPAVDALVEEEVRAQVPITSNASRFFDLWRSPDDYVREYQQFYMYNLTNPGAFSAGARPNVSLVGPFTYVQRAVKHHIRWSDNGTVVWFRYNRTFHLRDEPCHSTHNSSYGGGGGTPPDPHTATTCSLDDSTRMTTINSPLVTMVSILDNVPLGTQAMREELVGVLRAVADEVYGQEGLFITRSVREILFGYADPILEHFIDGVIERWNSLNLTKWNRTLPKLPELDPRIVLQSNASDAVSQHDSAILSGSNGTDQVFTYRAWAGHNYTLDFWNGCNASTARGRQWRHEGNMINGTDGRTFPPLLPKEQPIRVFAEDIYRSGTLYFNNTVEYEGVPLRRYLLAEWQMENQYAWPPNCAFEMTGPKGVMNLSAAFQGAPAFASKPNFLGADPILNTLVDGLQPPDPEWDETMLDIEPTTGGTFVGHQRLQINLRVTRKPALFLMRRLPKETYLPIFRADLQGKASQALINEYKDQIGLARSAERLVHTWALALGVVLASMGGVAVVAWYGRKAAEARALRAQQSRFPALVPQNYIGERGVGGGGGSSSSRSDGNGSSNNNSLLGGSNVGLSSNPMLAAGTSGPLQLGDRAGALNVAESPRGSGYGGGGGGVTSSNSSPRYGTLGSPSEDDPYGLGLGSSLRNNSSSPASGGLSTRERSPLLR